MPRAEWTWIKSVTFKTGVTKVDVKLYQALPRASVHVLNAVDKKPVRGALVFVDATTPGKTDINGVGLTKAAHPGLHPVTARKPGWGWVGATKTADGVRNIDFSGSKDSAVQIMMEPVWG